MTIARVHSGVVAAATLAGALLGTCAANAAAPDAAPDANPLRLRPHHITASVADLDRATAWYERMLGFTVAERGSRGPMSFVELRIPNFAIALVHVAGPASAPASAAGPAVHARAAATAPSTPADERPRWIHMVFAVPDPAATCELLRSRGAKVTIRGGGTCDRATSFLVDDSEGNELEFVGDSS